MTEFKHRPIPVNTYNTKLRALQALPEPDLKALATELHVPTTKAGPLLQSTVRLIARKLEDGLGGIRVADSILRKPLKGMPLPEPEEGELIVMGIVMAIALEKGIEPDEVNIPKAIPDSFGFYESSDPACKECSYLAPCKDWTIMHRPACFRVFHHRESAACLSCIVGPWCKTDLKTVE